MKELYAIVRLSDGNYATCKFVSAEPWIPMNKGVSLKETATPIEFYQLDYQDAYGAFSCEVQTLRSSQVTKS